MPKSSPDDRESVLYPIVERWMRRRFRCFQTGINIGLAYSRVDVVGIRDTGGDLSGEIETISIEVKRASAAFATSAGQAAGYRVYANRVYLAVVKPTGFDMAELDIASHLGVGLIQIKGKQCHEVLSSPFCTPITRMSLQLIERMSLGRCQMCGTFFQIGTFDPNTSSAKGRWSKVARENFDRAIEQEKGMIFWNRELADRKNRLGVRVFEDGSTHERRYVCPDCISYVFGAVAGISDDGS